ncbi:MAG TPA: PEGA domain-containing protein [Candidatus Didemnitutus sp.]|nr:PEGA domain-containing protein [Candidatus Didemnitutus sp.]
MDIDTRLSKKYSWQSRSFTRPAQKLVAPAGRDRQKVDADWRVMDLKESYRILGLEVGASRSALDAAYLGLLEKWHPTKAAEQGPAAAKEAQRRVQEINEAYNFLIAVVPGGKPTAAAPAAANVAPPSSPLSPPGAEAPRAPVAKPKLVPVSPAQPDVNRPPPPKPPPEAWTARPAGDPAAVSPPPPPPPAAAPPPPPVATRAAPPPKAATVPAPATVESAADVWVSKRQKPEPGFGAKFNALYDLAFPVGTPRRKFAPFVVVALVLILLLLGKCAFGSHHHGPSEPDPKKTGRLVVKSNVAGVTIEAKRIPSADDASTETFSGAAGDPLAGLPPGKYNVTAHVEGWTDLHGEATMTAAQLTELVLNFKGGSLKLSSDPSGALVRRGEDDLGKTPLTIPMLPPGECTLVVQYPSWPPVTFKTTIAEGGEAAATVRLPHGKLTVESFPSGATVMFGRGKLGTTPVTLPVFPAGNWKLTIIAKDFPPLELPITITDDAELKVNPDLGLAFPVLDPTDVLKHVWVPDSTVDVAPWDGLSGPSAPHNGYIKNLNRKRLYNDWMEKRYRYVGTVKSFDKNSGEIEFVESESEFCRTHIQARLAGDARADPELVARLIKGATFSFYGKLVAVEESRWGSKSVAFELSGAEPMR